MLQVKVHRLQTFSQLGKSKVKFYYFDIKPPGLMFKHLVQDLGHDLVDPEAGICCTKDWLWTTPSPFSTLFVAKVGQTSSQDDVTIRPGPDTI